MESVTRRSFLIKGSAGAVGAAAIAGGGVALASTGDGAPQLTDEELAALDEPVVMSIRDAATGEVELLVGEREVVFTDRKLVARVLRAGR